MIAEIILTEYFWKFQWEITLWECCKHALFVVFYRRFAYTGCVFAKTWFRWQKSDTWFSYIIRMLVGIAILAFCLRYCMSQSKLIKR